MAVWSSLFAVARKKLLPNYSLLSKGVPTKVITRCMSAERRLEIAPSRWQFHKTKDWMHFYFLVGAIPLVLLVTGLNIFVGPATLQPIPEGYIPKHWEYYKSPVTRLIAKYLITNPQQVYEVQLHAIARADRIRRRNRLVAEIQTTMAALGDQQGYYNPVFYGGRGAYNMRENLDM